MKKEKIKWPSFLIGLGNLSLAILVLKLNYNDVFSLFLLILNFVAAIMNLSDSITTKEVLKNNGKFV